MGIALPQVVTEDRASGAQVIDGSLKFDSAKSNYLNRTPSSSGNRKTFTWSGWVKRSKLGTWQMLLSAGSTVNDRTFIGFVGSDTATYVDQLTIVHIASGSATGSVYLNPKLRDTSEFYHIVVSVDVTNSTANDRVKGYINGVEVDVTVADAFESTDTQFNNTIVHETKKAATSSEYINGQVTQVYLIDGQALGPEYFGYTDPLTNTWRPKKAEIPGFNDGTVWSSNSTNFTNPGQGFNGNPTNYAEVSSSAAKGTFTFPKSIKVENNVTFIYSSGTSAHAQ